MITKNKTFVPSELLASSSMLIGANDSLCSFIIVEAAFASAIALDVARKESADESLGVLRRRPTDLTVRLVHTGRALGVSGAPSRRFSMELLTKTKFSATFV